MSDDASGGTSEAPEAAVEGEAPPIPDAAAEAIAEEHIEEEHIEEEHIEEEHIEEEQPGADAIPEDAIEEEPVEQDHDEDADDGDRPTPVVQAPPAAAEPEADEAAEVPAGEAPPEQADEPPAAEVVASADAQPTQDEKGTDGGFDLGAGFTAGEISGSLGLGPLEVQYEELFADVLADGVITADERARLEKAADNMGLDRSRLLRLEQAMMAAYHQRHKVEIIEQYEEPVASLAPLRVEAEGDAGRALLLKRIEQLAARVHELEDELRRAQASINVEVDLGELESTIEQASEDPDEYWRRLRRNPTDPEPFRQLYRIYDARGNTDSAWCAAQALVALGAANAAEQKLFEQHKSVTLISPRSGVSPAAWYDLLFHPEEEVLTGQIFSLIAPAVLVGRVTTLRRDGKLHQPPPSGRQDPAKATITAVRAVPWAAAILGLAPPPIFLEKDRDAGYQHIPGVPPMTVIGKRVLSGRTQNEHAFLAGRHLSFYRHEHFVKTLFTAVQDLEDLFLAALVIGNPGLPIAEDMRQRVQPIAQAIQPMLETPQQDALRGCFLRFVEEGGRTNLQRWSAAVDKTASRAGLLIANDLGTALGVLEHEEGKHGDLSKDLLAFAVSDRYFKLRRQLGIAVPSN